MTKILHIPTGIIFTIPDIDYFNMLFNDSVTSHNFLDHKEFKGMKIVIDCIDNASPNYEIFKSTTYRDSLIELKEYSIYAFEVLDD